ncbi:MAG: hypothetical protein MUC62_10650, partial [Candidatus Thermoplasmatota archaeon]|nr:hypothetical protein [Candidatus Thermoplasmatota archaeon]
MTEDETEDDLDSIADDIQKRIMEQEAKRFSARVLKEAREPNDHGRNSQGKGPSEVRGPCPRSPWCHLFQLSSEKKVRRRFLNEAHGPLRQRSS